jgi:hypothetical protein
VPCRERYVGVEETVAGKRDSGAGKHDVGALERGTSVGRYLVLDPIGHGGMGLVYAAFDPELDRKVAIKLLRADLASGAERRQLFRARLVREAQAMARLSHPNVVPVYDVGTLGDRLFVAMELVEGGTLKTWMREQKPRWREVLALFLQAGRGLAAAHAAGLVHRDFKPDNILVGRDGRPRVTDFGLARADSASDLPMLDDDRDSPAHLSGSLNEPLTREGAVMGTPGYMSPEQCMARPTDARSDQFSFCAALYESIYGERPFPGIGPEEVIESVRQGEIRQPPANSEVPAWVRKAVLRGLAFEPAARWASMVALLDALGRDPALRRRRFLTAAATVAVIGVAAVGVRARSQAVCRGAERKLDGIWDEARKERISRAFGATGLPYATRAWQEVSSTLSAYASAWTGMHTDACEATRVRGEQTESMLELRMTCLEGRRKELKALTDLFANADGDTVGEAVQAAGELQPVAMCGDLPMLTAAVPPPTDAHMRDEVDGLRTHLAEARALLQSGKYPAGLAAARAVLPHAHEVGYRPLEAEALELTGRLEHE